MGKTTNILDLNNRLEKVEKENVPQNNYNSLKNRPKINGNLLTGDKTGAQLGLAEAQDIIDINEKLTKKQTLVNLESAYDAGTDWTIIKQGNICVLNMSTLKDIPAGNTVIGNIPVGFRPEPNAYEYIYSANKDIHIGVNIYGSGEIQILNLTGAAISGTINFYHNVAYFTA